MRSRKISIACHDASTSVLEAASRARRPQALRRCGGRWKNGSRLDAWETHFRPSAWQKAFDEAGLDPQFYAARRRAYDEVLPWDHLDYGVDKEFFIREHRRALAGETTPSCRKAATRAARRPADRGGLPMPQLISMRVFFEKTHRRGVYISHLDLSRAMSRALARSGLPVWYTQGFHPHIYTTFALPLSLGVAGQCESMDFRLTQDVSPGEVAERLAGVQPQGLDVLFAAQPVMEPREIFWAQYKMEMVGDGKRICEAFESLAARGSDCAKARQKRRAQRGYHADVPPDRRLAGEEKGASRSFSAARAWRRTSTPRWCSSRWKTLRIRRGSLPGDTYADSHGGVLRFPVKIPQKKRKFIMNMACARKSIMLK